MKLELTLKQEYGNNRFYPANDTARIVCKIASCSTITETQLKLLRQLGFEIQIVLPSSIANLLESK